MTLVERGGSARSFHIDATTLNEVTRIVRDNVHHETIINTDEGVWYNQVGAHFLSHDTVNHSRYEYARDDITTNTVEGCYSIFKRGMKGVSALLREALAPLSFRVRLPLFQPRRIGRQRRGTCGPCHQGRGWQASHVS
jgi:hypothetical protein